MDKYFGNLMNNIKGIFGLNKPNSPLPAGEQLTPSQIYAQHNDQSRAQAAHQANMRQGAQVTPTSLQQYVSPTSTPFPGQNEFVSKMVHKYGGDPKLYAQTYTNAATSPGGKYYQQNQKMNVLGTTTSSPMNQRDLIAHISKGLSGTPAASLAAYFAQAGQGLPDPYLPAVLARKETGGGKNMADKNNFLNIQYGGINNSPYDTPEQNIIGGNGKKGFPGVIHSGLYDKYLKSKNLNDFFATYTPHVDNNGRVINGSYPEQIQQYNAIRHDFE